MPANLDLWNSGVIARDLAKDSVITIPAKDAYFFLYPSTTTPPAKPGDFNGDNKVDLLDFNLIITSFGSPYTILDFNTENHIHNDTLSYPSVQAYILMP